MTIEVLVDPIAERLDEMAELAQCWKKQREKGVQPRAIRSAMSILSRIIEAQEAACKNKMERVERLTSGGLEK